MQFSSGLVNAFRRLSRDENPLHTDPVYAHTSAFGRPVVFGMATVLRAIGEWAKDREFTLTKIRGEFRKPIFTDQDYRLEIGEEAMSIRLRWLRGPAVQTEIELEWRAGSSPTRIGTDSPNLRKSPAARPELRRDDRQDYGPGGNDADLAPFSLRRGQFPDAQLAALLWASYFVGMECPGRQALFANFEFSFREGTSSSFSVTDLSTEMDERFNQIIVSGKGTGIEEFRLEAFVRPEPIRADFAALRRGLSAGTAFAGKVVLITGSSRGFGSTLAAGFAAQGASVVLHFRKSREAAAALARELEDAGHRAWIVEGDVGERTDVERIAGFLESRGLALDFLVNNASATIENLGFLEQGTGKLVDFVDRSVRAYALPIECLHARLNKNATIVQISSAYAIKPEPGFTHYAAAKGAIEGMTRALAQDFKKLRFIVARPPRMLTDQTNSAFANKASQDTVAVVNALIARLAAPSAANFEEIDL